MSEMISFAIETNLPKEIVNDIQNAARAAHVPVQVAVAQFVILGVRSAQAQAKILKQIHERRNGGSNDRD